MNLKKNQWFKPQNVWGAVVLSGCKKFKKVLCVPDSADVEKYSAANEDERRRQPEAEPSAREASIAS